MSYPRHNQIFLKKLLDSIFWTPGMGVMVRVFANDPEDLCSIPRRVIPKTQPTAPLQRGKNPPTNVCPGMTLNNLMVKFQ